MSKARGRYLFPMLLAFGLALLAKLFVIDLAVVDGPSMNPTLHEGQVVAVFRLAYGLRLPPGLGGIILPWSQPRPGDLVVARNPLSGAAVIKRVGWMEPVAVGEAGKGPGSVWLLGDNPAESLDSRSYGAVPVEEIAGRVLLFGPRP